MGKSVIHMHSEIKREMNTGRSAGASSPTARRLPPARSSASGHQVSRRPSTLGSAHKRPRGAATPHISISSMNKLLLVCICLAAAASAASVPPQVEALLEASPNLRLLHRVYSECAAKEAGMATCLKARALSFVDKVSRMDNVPLAEGLAVVRIPGAAPERQSRALSEAELESANDQTISDLFVQRVASFFNGRTLQFELPKVSEQEVERSLEEGEYICYLLFH